MGTKYARRICAIVITLSSAALMTAQDLRVVHFKGIINDYSPSNVAGGPYEIRGTWSLDVQGGAAATFTADLTMETSDYGISNSTAIDPNNPSTRNAHTHHIAMTSTSISYDTSVCPAYNPPTTGSGVVVNATATTTGNGGPASFESKGPSTIQVCITGGTQVEFSNLSIVYTGPATGHFGPQAIHGVVTQVSTK